MSDDLFDTSNGGATFSPCGRYRYTLSRGLRVAPILWIMLNPSTADDNKDDPTIRRCRAFSLAWGFERFEICNLFALRSTNPKALYSDPDPIGPDNDEHIRRAVERAHGLVIVAWGRHGKLRDRDALVLKLIGTIPECLGTNADGTPRHPLYLAADTEAEAYTGRCP